MPAWFLAAWAEAANFVKQNGAAFLADFLLTALLAYPLYAYVRFVWQQKADEISTSLQKAAKQTYLRVFQQVTVSQDEAPARFDAYYRKWYGRNRLGLARNQVSQNCQGARRILWRGFRRGNHLT